MNCPFYFPRRLTHLRSISLLVFSLARLEAQTVTPLVTPSIIPTQESQEDGIMPESVLGFGESSGLLPLNDGLGVLPGDPNALPDDFLDRLIAADPKLFEGHPLLDTPEELSELMDNPAIVEGMVADDFSNLPWMPAVKPSITGGGFSGFSNTPGNFPMGGGGLDNLRKGLTLLATLNGVYDTNPLQGSAPPGDSGQGDFLTTLGGTVAYRSSGSTWTYGVNYTGSYIQYFKLTDLSGYNQNAGASLDYEGGPLTVGLTLGITSGSGANRFSGSVVDQIDYSYGLSARYRISEKTSLTSQLSQSISEVSGGASTSSLDFGASALWRYSPLTEIGPGIRYTQRSGDLQQERTSIGPTLTVNYQLAKKVSLASTIGMDFVSFESGDAPDPSLFTSIGLNYRASSLWGMSLSLLRDAQASYSNPDEFEEITALRLGYNRSIRRALWTIGLGWEIRSSENPDPLAAVQSDINFLTIDTSLSMPIFKNTTNASIFMRYQDQSGGSNKSWNSLQLGFGLNRTF